jgi:DNA-binding IclR family transcriptional regulator
MASGLRLEDRALAVMAHKYAQRREVEDIARQLGAGEQEVQDVLDQLQRKNFVRRWPDKTWGLTSAGNLRRNRLTA